MCVLVIYCKLNNVVDNMYRMYDIYVNIFEETIEEQCNVLDLALGHTCV